MKKILFIFSFFIITQNIYSQINYFNNYFNPNNTGSYSLAIYPINNGYVCAGIMADILNSNNNIVLSKHDSIGNLISYKEIKDDFSNFYIGTWGGSGFAKCKSGGYILGGDIEHGLTIEVYLKRLNENFDTLWTKTIKDDSVYSSISQCIETSDHGIAICGQKEIVTQNRTNAVLYKTDSLGNLKWEKTYNITGYNGDRWDKAWNVTETPDKGYLLGCYTYDVQSMGSYHGSGDGVVIKTDSMGNLQWTKNVGGPEMDGGVTTRVCQDGNYLIATEYSCFTADYNDHYRGKLRLMKVNPAGSVIWDRQYEPEIISISAMKIIELADGAIVVGGTKHHRVSFYQGYFDSYLFKVNSNGDSIWYREYAKSTDTIQLTWNRLYNFEQTPDGGFVACGELIESTIIPQSIWVFKTDSFGCLQPGCQNQVGVQEIGKSITALTVYPNPATIQATITYPVLTSQGQLQVYNTLGQMVYEEALAKNNAQTVLDTKIYEKGLYKVVVREGGEIIGQVSLVITK